MAPHLWANYFHLMSRQAAKQLAPFCLLCSTRVAFAQERAPLQADVSVLVDGHGKPVSLSAPLSGGRTDLTGSRWTFVASFIALKFDYRTADDIALNEIISKISSRWKILPVAHFRLLS